VARARTRHEYQTGILYQHRCSPANYEAVALAADRWEGDRGFTLVTMRAATGVPHSQGYVAISFLADRLLITRVHGRRHVPSGGSPDGGWIYHDAMLEYHALRDGAPTD
jgi:hypothetical protein